MDYKPSNQDYEKIIHKGDVDTLVECAEKIGKGISKVKNSQLRGIFASARQIQTNWPSAAGSQSEPNDTLTQKANDAYRQAVLLRPRISYAGSRNALEGLDSILNEALKLVNGKPEERRTRYFRFVDFFEAIVAYHKLHGGRN